MSCPRKMAVDHRLKPEPSGKQSQAGARAAPGDLYFDSLIQRRQSENSRRQAFASFLSEYPIPEELKEMR